MKDLENKNLAAGTFIDLTKAFDTVDHQILLFKIEKLEIRGVAYNWIQNYLTIRLQSVRIYKANSNDYTTSNLNYVTHGVPQGSILGPKLFITYINDITSSIKHGQLFSYADETTILVNDKEIEDAYIKIYENLTSIIDWFNANKLSINLTKTNYMLFHPNQRRSNHKYK